MAERLLAKGEKGKHQCNRYLKLFDFIGNGEWIPTTCPDCEGKGPAIADEALFRWFEQWFDEEESVFEYEDYHGSINWDDLQPTN